MSGYKLGRRDILPLGVVALVAIGLLWLFVMAAGHSTSSPIKTGCEKAASNNPDLSQDACEDSTRELLEGFDR